MTDVSLDFKSLLQGLASAEAAATERDQALIARDQAITDTAALMVQSDALRTVIDELEARIADLAKAISPAERSAEAEAVAIRAEVQDHQKTLANQMVMIHNNAVELDSLDSQIQHAKSLLMEYGRQTAPTVSSDERAAHALALSLKDGEIVRLTKLLEAQAAEVARG